MLKRLPYTLSFKSFNRSLGKHLQCTRYYTSTQEIEVNKTDVIGVLTETIQQAYVVQNDSCMVTYTIVQSAGGVNKIKLLIPALSLIQL